MNTTLKILLRIVLLVAILVAMNYIYKYFFFEKDLQQYSDVINLIREVPDNAEIIYIGESSNISTRSDDIDKRSISGFISDFFPDLTVSDITKPASHAGIYKTLLSKIPDTSNVKTVVVTLNLRSFNAQWIHSKLETSLQKSMVLLKDNPPIVNRFLLSFKAYDIKTNDERDKQVKKKWENDILNFDYPFPQKNVIDWDYSMAHTGIKDSNNNIDYETTSLACHYIKGYAFQIDTLNNPRIKDLNDIIDLAENRGWNLIFNLLAENTEKAQELVGDDLLYLMEQNRKLLIDYFQRKGVTMVDNLYAITNEQFIDQDWTTEHYAEKGRKIIAKNIAQQLKKFYPDEYYDVDYSINFQTLFFNNCEKKEIWGQMQTLTDENAFSGKFSSKTGKGDEFSITFEYPFQIIPDSSKDYININLKVFQYSSNHNAKLVVELSGEEIEYYWYGTPVKEYITEVNNWNDLNFVFQIPDNTKQANLIKIYIYNPSDVLILLDDFKIEFE